MHTLVEGDLEQFLGMHLVRVEFNQQQVGLFVVVGYAHDAFVRPDEIGNFCTAIVVY